MPIAATKTKEKGITEIILFKFEETCESGNRKHVLQLVAHARDANFAPLRLGSLQHTQEQAQTARRNEFQVRAVKNNVFTNTKHIPADFWKKFLSAAILSVPALWYGRIQLRPAHP